MPLNKLKFQVLAPSPLVERAGGEVKKREPLAKDSLYNQNESCDYEKDFI